MMIEETKRPISVLSTLSKVFESQSDKGSVAAWHGEAPKRGPCYGEAPGQGTQADSFIGALKLV